MVAKQPGGVYQSSWLHKWAKKDQGDSEHFVQRRTGMREIFEEAILPLVNSVGLAVAPYVFIPLIAGFVARIINDSVRWPTSIEILHLS